jgi:short-chain fatty acids transporter
MLALGLLLHGSVRSYLAAAEGGARACSGILIQFPLFGGVIAMMQVSGLVGTIAGWFAAHGTATTVPLMSFFAACLINLFVPSGGAQWAIQGPVALESAMSVGITDLGKMVMTVAYGDQTTNMLQPFWALPLLAITGVRARDIVGYSAFVMFFAMAWLALGLLAF